MGALDRALFLCEVSAIMPALVIPAFRRVFVVTRNRDGVLLGEVRRRSWLSLRGCVFWYSVATSRHAFSLRLRGVTARAQSRFLTDFSFWEENRTGAVGTAFIEDDKH